MILHLHLTLQLMLFFFFHETDRVLFSQSKKYLRWNNIFKQQVFNRSAKREYREFDTHFPPTVFLICFLNIRTSVFLFLYERIIWVENVFSLDQLNILQTMIRILSADASNFWQTSRGSKPREKRPSMCVFNLEFPLANLLSIRRARRNV